MLSILNHDSAIASAAAADDRGRGRPALHRDGLAAHPRAGRGRRRPGGLHRRLRAPPPTSRPAARYGVPDRGTAAHAFTLLHDSERTAFAAQVDGARAAARRCWSTPTTSTEAVATAVEVAGPELGAVRIDSGDLLAAGPRGARASSTRSARQHPDRGHQRPRRVRDRRRWRRPRSTPTASAPSWSPAPAHPTAGLVYKLVAREADARARRADGPVAKKQQGQGQRRRPQVGPAPASSPTASAQAEVIGIGDAPADDGDDRDAAGASSWPTARSSAGSRSPRPASATPALARRAAAIGPPALARRAGHPDDRTRQQRPD